MSNDFPTLAEVGERNVRQRRTSLDRATVNRVLTAEHDEEIEQFWDNQLVRTIKEEIQNTTFTDRELFLQRGDL